MDESLKQEILRAEYIARINKVQDYIETHQGEELPLRKLAQIANFSPYYFHRIFRALTGEPLFQYIQRVRLEKAAFMLLVNQKKSITEIALECGFSNQSSFARAFKKHYQISASELRANPDSIEKSKNGKVKSKNGKDSPRDVMYNNTVACGNHNTRRGRFRPNLPFSVEVKDIEEMAVAYIRHTGPYKEDTALFAGLFQKLCKWGEARRLINYETKWLTLCHDNPELTDDNKLRISVCMTVPFDTGVDGEVGKMVIAGGKYAVGHFQLGTDQYREAWDALFVEWLPDSGYQPDDGQSFEFYNKLNDNTASKQNVDIYIPVRPL